MVDQKRSENRQDDDIKAAGAAGAGPLPASAEATPPNGQMGAGASQSGATASPRQDGSMQRETLAAHDPTLARPDLPATGTRMMASAGAIGGGAVSATREVLRGAIGATEDVATGLVGGVTHVAVDIVHGVHDVGMEVRDGATGLIGAVGSVGGSAVHAVANLLIDMVGGVRHVVGAAMGHNGNGRLREADGAVRNDHEQGYQAPPATAAGIGRDSDAGGGSTVRH